MSKYWREFWDQHVATAGDDPYHQVARTQDQEPMSRAMFLKIAAHFIDKLELEAHHSVLDLCCGNGLLSVEMARVSKRVVGVDFSRKLIAEMALRAPANLSGIVGDILEIKFQPGSFHRILFAAALQHFSQAQVIRLFEEFALWLKPDGILLVTDVLDAQRIWNFFDSEGRERAYFIHTMNEQPILGTWFDRIWLQKLARHVGFSEARVFDQPDDYWYSHYRFDLGCRG